MNSEIPSPIKELKKTRTLEFIWLADHSYSMEGRKISVLNQVIRNVRPDIAKAAHDEGVQVNMRVIRFSNNAAWHVGPTPIPIGDFTWSDLQVEGATGTAQAINLLCSAIDADKMPKKGLPPIFILISDGFCTDPPDDYERAIQKMLGMPWGKRAVRLAIACGDESDYSKDELAKFISHPEIGVLEADTPQKLIGYIIWASIQAVTSVSSGKSTMTAAGPSVAMTPPTAEEIKSYAVGSLVKIDDDEDVF